jgi:tripartite ATP-independent transporter DctM subunit
MTFKQIAKILLETAVTSSTIVFIVACASSFSWLIAMEGIPNAVTSFITSITTNPAWILLILNIILLIMGCFMEALSILTIIVPFLMPLITQLKMDPIHLGVVVVLNLMIGLSTPPVGLGLFVVSKIGQIKLSEIYKEIVPFLVPLIVVLIIITNFLDTVLWLPNIVFAK